ncbi:SURF1-like protein [Marinobacterium zhoushanense]|uniref:SURF1-like protein n=2 Tax=Marinobacterium zhoushanense TaxID=1679163 RepID=A0ABQ1L0F6_9GAMM|nr:SURF1-like protein [Marinobacterium zhoushanense]
MGKRFGARVWLYPLWLLMLTLLCALGVWQLERAEQKRQWLTEQQGAALNNPTQAELEYALAGRQWVPVRLTGEWIPEEPLFLDNRTHEGRVGYEVLLPARLITGQALLVNLGWIEAPERRELKPGVARPTIAQLEGVIGRPVATYTLSERQLSADWRLQRLDTQQAGEQWQLQLEPWVLWLKRPAQRDMVPRLPGSATMAPERHLGYAVQWFALALTLVLIVGVLEWKAHKQPRKAG